MRGHWKPSCLYGRMAAAAEVCWPCLKGRRCCVMVVILCLFPLICAHFLFCQDGRRKFEMRKGGWHKFSHFFLAQKDLSTQRIQGPFTVVSHEFVSSAEAEKLDSNLLLPVASWRVRKMDVNWEVFSGITTALWYDGFSASDWREWILAWGQK